MFSSKKILDIASPAVREISDENDGLCDALSEVSMHSVASIFEAERARDAPAEPSHLRDIDDSMFALADCEYGDLGKGEILGLSQIKQVDECRGKQLEAALGEAVRVLCSAIRLARSASAPEGAETRMLIASAFGVSGQAVHALARELAHRYSEIKKFLELVTKESDVRLSMVNFEQEVTALTNGYKIAVNAGMFFKHSPAFMATTMIHEGAHAAVKGKDHFYLFSQAYKEQGDCIEDLDSGEEIYRYFSMQEAAAGEDVASALPMLMNIHRDAETVTQFVRMMGTSNFPSAIERFRTNEEARLGIFLHNPDTLAFLAQMLAMQEAPPLVEEPLQKRRHR